nr:hypothetical protein [Pseudomonas benzenivorans]
MNMKIVASLGFSPFLRILKEKGRWFVVVKSFHGWFGKNCWFNYFFGYYFFGGGMIQKTVEGDVSNPRVNFFSISIFLFFLIFGWKVKYFDLSVFVPFILLPFVVRRASISFPFFLFFLLLSILFVYQLSVQVFNDSFDVEPLGRILRSIFVVFIVGVFCSSMDCRDLIKVLRILIVVIVMHAVFIIVTAFSLPLAELASSLSGNERFRWMRSSGLLAGFDIAGFITIIGILLLTSRASFFSDGMGKFMGVVILFFAACFASRVTMMFAGILFFLYVGRLVFFGKLGGGAKISILFASVFLCYFAFTWFLKVLDVTFSLGVVDVSSAEVEVITSIFSAQREGGFLWAHMFFLPDNLFGVFFGVGSEPGNSDVGYVREIFRYGVVGLVFVIVTHLLFLLFCFSGKRKFFSSLEFKLAFVLLLFILVLTFKNNYLLVRGVFPCFVLISYCLGCLFKRSAGFGRV